MRRIATVLCFICLLLLPIAITSEYYVNLSTQILIAAIFALSLNLLVGYGGMTSLGHAAYLGAAAYSAAWLMLNHGFNPLHAAFVALAITTAMAAIFGILALRASGLSFLMITLAFGQILWGLAYRWVNVTGGDNGLSGMTRPAPFGIDLSGAAAFYYFTLLVFLSALGLIGLLIRSPFGATLRGTRDQPRRMSALGHNIWMIRWMTFIMAGFWGAVAGVLYVYYHQFISPHALSLTNSAEVLLMVISGGAGTLLGPIVGAGMVVVLKNVVSAYIERWTMLLGFVFLLIVMYMPDGVVPGLARLWQRLQAGGKSS